MKQSFTGSSPLNPEEPLYAECSTGGGLVRILELGQKASGAYISKDKAAYWDGKNEAGEQVSSGVYFYTIQAGDFTATRKMVVAR